MRKFIFIALCVAIGIGLSSGKSVEKTNSDITLTLKWNKAYLHDTIDKSALGLEWAYSFVGALLPNSPSGITVGTQTIIVNPDHLGFSEEALQKMRLLHKKLKASEEYKSTKTIDLGRYITLLIGASEHYYAITGMPKKIDEAFASYVLEPEIGYVNNSGVSLIHRNIRFSKRENGKQFFVATEIDSVTGTIYEFETLELMANGQPRFGIYDDAGNLKNSANQEFTNAGKPAKCMWCHESKISKMFNVQQDFSGFLTYLQLQDKFITYNQMLDEFKSALPGGVDFSQKQQHTQTELLYISFMEPSAERLSLEWGIPKDQVQKKLAGLPTHIYDEFPFLGNLYHRKDVENVAPFKGLPVSSNVREQSEIEVNHMN